jgi:hypothetical protein
VKFEWAKAVSAGLPGQLFALMHDAETWPERAWTGDLRDSPDASRLHLDAKVWSIDHV